MRQWISHILFYHNSNTPYENPLTTFGAGLIATMWNGACRSCWSFYLKHDLSMTLNYIGYFCFMHFFPFNLWSFPCDIYDTVPKMQLIQHKQEANHKIMTRSWLDRLQNHPHPIYRSQGAFAWAGTFVAIMITERHKVSTQAKEWVRLLGWDVQYRWIIQKVASEDAGVL